MIIIKPNNNISKIHVMNKLQAHDNYTTLSPTSVCTLPISLTHPLSTMASSSRIVALILTTHPFKSSVASSLTLMKCGKRGYQYTSFMSCKKIILFRRLWILKSTCNLWIVMGTMWWGMPSINKIIVLDIQEFP